MMMDPLFIERRDKEEGLTDRPMMPFDRVGGFFLKKKGGGGPKDIENGLAICESKMTNYNTVKFYYYYYHRHHSRDDE